MAWGENEFDTLDLGEGTFQLLKVLIFNNVEAEITARQIPVY